METGGVDDSVVVERQVDQLCDQLEQAWKTGEPKLDEFIGDVEDHNLPVLLRELIPLDIHCREQRGIQVRASHYAALFSDHHQLVRSICQRFIDDGSDVSRLVDSKALAKPLTDLPSKIGKYQVIEFLGSGGQAEVFKAMHPLLKQEVVIKVGRFSSSSANNDRLINEGRLLTQLEHPNICRVLDLDFHDGKPFIAMHYVAGKTLREITLDDKAAVVLLEKVARAVEFAHSKGVIHQDIKPSNVIMDKSGEPFLIDFGLARFESDETDGIVGTVGYMSPEAAKANKALIGPRTDVFGLGALLHFLLVTRPPLEGDTFRQTLEQAKKGKTDFPLLDRVKTPNRLKAICKKALARNPAQRHESAAEFADTLKKANGSLALGYAAAIGLLVLACFAYSMSLIKGENSTTSSEPEKVEKVVVSSGPKPHPTAAERLRQRNGIATKLGDTQSDLHRVSDSVVFLGKDNQLWATDGTVDGTGPLTTFTGNGIDRQFNAIGRLSNRFYFSIDDGEHGAELWSTDGTANGTQLVNDIFKGPESSSVGQGTVAGNYLYFTARDAEHGVELWAVGEKGTAELVKDIRRGQQGSDPKHLLAAGDNLLFMASKEIVFRRQELDHSWFLASDGKANLVRNLEQTHYLDGPTGLLVKDNYAYLNAWDEQYGEEVWRIDLPNGDAERLTDCNGSTKATQPRRFYWMDDELVFMVNKDHRNNYPRILFLDTNQENGIRQISVGTWMEVANGRMFCGDDDEIWVSGGPRKMAQLANGFKVTKARGAEGRFLPIGDRFILVGTQSQGIGHELWITDDSSFNVQLLKDFHTGPASTAFRLTYQTPTSLCINARPAENRYGFGTNWLIREGSRPRLFSDVAGATCLKVLTIEGEQVCFYGQVPGTNDLGYWKTDGTSEGTLFLGNSKISPNLGHQMEASIVFRSASYPDQVFSIACP